MNDLATLNNVKSTLDEVSTESLPITLPNPVPLTTQHPASFADRKLRGGQVLGGFVSRIINPKHLYQAAKLHHGRREARKQIDDAQLELYAKTMPGDFLHFGYFDDTTREPLDMTLNDITQAQNRYADHLLELIVGGPQKVLDVGCGMGGLSRMLTARGDTITAVTPDRSQAAYVKQSLPDVTVVRSKFEAIEREKFAGQFNTIFTAESLQYLKLDIALPLLADLLAPGGRWIACDFFYNAPSEDRSLHCWPEFKEKLAKSGWKLAYERDITPNILPTLRYIHMWAQQFGLPFMNFAFNKFERKQPGLHHLCLSTLQTLKKFAQSNVDLIDPLQFTIDKRYVLMAIERA